MILVGLTGGIGSGKSSVSNLLHERGAVIIDGDAIARQLQRSGTPVFQAILDRFDGVVGTDGELDRARLAQIVFPDPEALADLNAIVHPALGVEILHQIEQLRSTDQVVILDFPLLAEAPRRGLSGIVVVDIDPQMAIERVVRDRGMQRQDVEARVARQVSRQTRVAIADRVIDNSGSLEDLKREVALVWDWIVGLPAAGADAGELQ